MNVPGMYKAHQLTAGILKLPKKLRDKILEETMLSNFSGHYQKTFFLNKPYQMHCTMQHRKNDVSALHEWSRDNSRDGMRLRP